MRKKQKLGQKYDIFLEKNRIFLRIFWHIPVKIDKIPPSEKKFKLVKL